MFSSSTVYTSWMVSKYLINENLSAAILSCLFLTTYAQKQSKKQNIIVITTDGFRWQEVLTFASSREYIKPHHPKVTFIGFGKTDHYSHEDQCDLYFAVP